MKERERDRKRARKRERERESLCVCMRVCARARVYVRLCVSVCVSVRAPPVAFHSMYDPRELGTTVLKPPVTLLEAFPSAPKT